MATAENKDLTIVLLLKGRDPFTVRWFEYAREVKIPFKVLVADGGHEHGLEAKIADLGFSASIDYEWVRFPFDATHRMFYEKTFRSLELVKTPFMIFASNDDFYLFDELKASIEFLKQHSEFVSSRGEIWDFNVSKRSGWWGFHLNDHVYGDVGGLQRLYFHPAVTGDSALGRVADLSCKFHSVWHEVIRTEPIREALSALLDMEIEDFRFFELFLSFYVATRGQFHRTLDLHMLHQVQPDSAALKIVGDTKQEWMNGKSWGLELDRFIDGIAAQISRIDGIPLEKAKLEFQRLYLVNILARGGNAAESNESPKAKVLRYLRSAVRKNPVAFNVAKKISLIAKSGKPKAHLPERFEQSVAIVDGFMKKCTREKKR